MLTRFSSKWKWYDWLFLLFLLFLVVGLLRAAFPDTAFAADLHKGFHAISLFLEWVGNGLNTLGGQLDQI